MSKGARSAKAVGGLADSFMDLLMAKAGKSAGEGSEEEEDDRLPNSDQQTSGGGFTYESEENDGEAKKEWAKQMKARRLSG